MQTVEKSAFALCEVEEEEAKSNLGRSLGQEIRPKKTRARAKAAGEQCYSDLKNKELKTHLIFCIMKLSGWWGHYWYQAEKFEIQAGRGVSFDVAELRCWGKFQRYRVWSYKNVCTFNEQAAVYYPEGRKSVMATLDLPAGEYGAVWCA